MTLKNVKRSSHGKSAMATYLGNGFRLNVYLYNNIPCTNDWGPNAIVCYMKPKKGREIRSVFENYAEFRNYRNILSLTEDFN